MPFKTFSHDFIILTADVLYPKVMERKTFMMITKAHTASHKKSFRVINTTQQNSIIVEHGFSKKKQL